MVALAAMLVVPGPFDSSVEPLPRPVKHQLELRGFWHPGCPVPLSGLRLLTVPYRDFEGEARTGQLVVNKSAARPLVGVFRRLYRLHFPIRHMSFADRYGPRRSRPDDGDVSGSFQCRQAVPSPCTGGSGTGSWSMHAYGLAVDLNPRENPYVGCGQSSDPAARRYRDRSPHRPGMVTRGVVRAFRSIGWGWGGGWTGNSRYAWEQDRRREREARARGDEFRRYTWGDVFESQEQMLAELRTLLGPR